jgi:hypothetical protein
MNINEADKVVHPVETQWHYPIMVEHGYVPDTKEAVGFVRAYRYTHPITHHSIIAMTGGQTDHWSDPANNAVGFWAALALHLKKLTT